MKLQDPQRFQRFENFRNFVKSNTANQISNNQRLINSNGIITIPVVVHVLHKGEAIGVGRNISLAQIQSQIDVLNEDFRRLNGNRVNTPSVFQPIASDFGIEFKLACMNPEGKYTDGIIRTNTGVSTYTVREGNQFTDEVSTGIKVAGTRSIPWPTDKYLNIWVCSIRGHSNPFGIATSITTYIGYATWPADFNTRPQYDGIIITTNAFGRVGNTLSPYVLNLGRTTTHEVVHWLGLRHIWGDAHCGNDGISDTPPQEEQHYNSCPNFPSSSSCSINSYGDMFMNFMDYSLDACRNMFTIGQLAVC